MNFWLLLQGFSLGASMIIPIGAQNAYVLNQGIKRNHHLTTATICSISDACLISVGIFGGGSLFSQNETLLALITVAGVLFLSWYGYLSLKSALHQERETTQTDSMNHGKRVVILGTLAVTLLNPHLYLDTVVILGSIGGQFEGYDRLSFALGTILASFIWFYGLSIGAARLAPTLSRPAIKKRIDLAVAMIMFIVAAMLAITLID